MPNLHIQTLKHVYTNELYIWHIQRRNCNTHIYSNDIWQADKQYNSDKNDPKLESCRDYLIFTQLKNNNNNNVKSYQNIVDHKSYILK